MAYDHKQASDFDDVGTNPSNNPFLTEIARAKLSRRQVLMSGAGAVGAAVFGTAGMAVSPTAKAAGPALGFDAVDKNKLDTVTVPEGYSVRTLYSLGDRLVSSIPEYANDGSDGDFDLRAGDHHDGMEFFGMAADGSFDPTASDRGLLCINHENITDVYLHRNGPTYNEDGTRAKASEVTKEIEAHGVTVMEIAKDADGQFQVVVDSPYNRRITAATRMILSGPLRESPFAVTKYDPTGVFTRGTVNNCAHGVTPWGTYLTCEENYAFYFRRAAGDDANRSASENQSLARYGISPGAGGSYAWSTIDADRYKRWDITVDTGTDAAGDYRNAAYTFGYIVEIDPFNPGTVPKKRSAMGRFAHEGCWPALVVEGQPVVFYSGCDSRGEYMYKFVSQELWSSADIGGGLEAGNKYLNRGKLYVARFNADGFGEWLELSFGVNGLDESNSLYPFSSQADVLVNTRLAADSVGATKMDRPEWGAVNPLNGEVYLTLTNNSNRRVVPTSSSHIAVDAANPRSYDTNADGAENGNANGHIIRWRETNSLADATSFQWDIYLFGSRGSYDESTINLSGLGARYDFSSPDGLWFDSRGLVWIQTDDGAYQDVTNCMMLVGRPGEVGDGESVAVNGVTTYVGAQPGYVNLRRFLVGPLGSEITGITMTPDYRTIFVNIQHPGENGDLDVLESSWPAEDGVSRPRSATIVITRDDGGEIAV